jgi:tetratricopeptide (TPR) repeat protein
MKSHFVQSRRRARSGPCIGAILFFASLSSPYLLRSAPAGAAEKVEPTPDDLERTARRHYAQGEAAFKAERYESALKEFEAGYAVSPRPGFLLNMGQTERKLGHLRKARSLYKKFLLIEPTSSLATEVKEVIAELDSALADEDLVVRDRDGDDQPRGATPSERPTTELPRIAPPTAPAGAVGSPLLVAAEPATPADRQLEQSTPVYRRTWFWVTLGALVLAGGGAALYATQRSTSDPFHAAGSLGAVGP